MEIPAKEALLPYFFAGMMGLCGVVMLAAGSHPPAQSIMATGGQFLLFHAPAVIALGTQRAFDGVYKRAALALLLAGPIVFATEIAVHSLIGLRVPFMAPLGGGMTMLGWLCVAIGALRARPS